MIKALIAAGLALGSLVGIIEPPPNVVISPRWFALHLKSVTEPHLSARIGVVPISDPTDTVDGRAVVFWCHLKQGLSGNDRKWHPLASADILEISGKPILSVKGWIPVPHDFTLYFHSFGTVVADIEANEGATKHLLPATVADRHGDELHIMNDDLGAMGGIKFISSELDSIHRRFVLVTTNDDQPVSEASQDSSEDSGSEAGNGNDGICPPPLIVFRLGGSLLGFSTLIAVAGIVGIGDGYRPVSLRNRFFALCILMSGVALVGWGYIGPIWRGMQGQCS